MINSVLFVCTGNTCRSVMAEYLLRDRAKKAGIELKVASAGVGAFAGDSAADNAVKVLAELGLDASNHRSKLTHPHLLEEFELILVMTESHKLHLLQLAPHLSERIFLLKELSQTAGAGQDLGDEMEKTYNILDPFGQSIEVYRESREEIDDAVNEILQNIIMEGNK